MNTAYLSTPSSPRVLLSRPESVVTIANATTTLLSWPTVRQHAGGLVSGSNATNVTIRQNGLYAFSASVTWYSNTSGARSLVINTENAGGQGVIIQSDDAPTPNANKQQTVSAIVHAREGQRVFVQVAQHSGGDLGIAGFDVFTWFSVAKIN